MGKPLCVLCCGFGSIISDFFRIREEFLLPKTPPLAEQGKTGGSMVEEGGKEAGFRPFFSYHFGMGYGIIDKIMITF